MAKGLKDGEPNGRDVYPDIIDHPHHQSPTRPHMSLYDRAAQFAAFDALAGYTDMVKEEQRETDTQIHLEGWVFFASPFCKKLQSFFAESCDCILQRIAGLHCKPTVTSHLCQPDRIWDGLSCQ